MDKPKGLYIPPIYENTVQTIKWTPVENAVTYKIEASIDGNFSSNAVLVYEGSGMSAAGIDSGYIWQEIDDISKTWQEWELQGLTWNAIERLSTTGISWNSMESRFLAWSELEEKEWTWNDFDTLPAEDGEMLSCTVSVPNDKQSMRFRISAFDGTTWSNALVSERRSIMHTRRGIFGIKQGDLLTVQIDGVLVRKLLGANFIVYYDETSLLVENVRLRNIRKTEPMREKPYIYRKSLEQIKFKYMEEIVTDELWDGLVIDIRFIAQKSGKTAVVFERSNQTEERII